MSETPAIKLSELQRKVLVELVEGYDPHWDEHSVFQFKYLAKEAKITIRQARLACRALKRKGLAEYGHTVNGDYQVSGSGYWASKAGAELIDPERLREAGKIA